MDKHTVTAKTESSQPFPNKLFRVSLVKFFLAFCKGIQNEGKSKSKNDGQKKLWQYPLFHFIKYLTIFIKLLKVSLYTDSHSSV